MSTQTGKLVVLAIGGNSLIADPSRKSVQDQYLTTLKTCGVIAGLIERGHRVVITHGNGPQVGFILRRSELAGHELHLVPLDSCGADTQGAIGYHIQLAMHNSTRHWKKPAQVATVVTQVLVDSDDAAFKKPSKPIGSFMDADTAKERSQKEGWHVVEDAGRGFRRVVASPRPQKIIEINAIRALLEKDFVVVAVGGGGVPVYYQPDGTLTGAEAVIDKDLASSLLAREIGADLLVISTAVEKACLNFGKPNQQALDRLTIAQAEKHIADKQFAPGSMLPKIQAMLEFVRTSHKAAVLTDPENLLRGIEGQTGTWIIP